MKTTIELPEELLGRARAEAIRAGQSFKDFLTTALRDHLARSEGVPTGTESWRRVFGKAKPAQVAEVDRVVAEDLELIDAETWR